MESVSKKNLVNPIAVKNCWAVKGEDRAQVLDISFMRVVVESAPFLETFAPQETFPLDFQLDRQQFSVIAEVAAKGEGWIRLAFQKIVPSSKAHLRSFLSPKKIGESILEDWRTDQIRHYHGLNESELWFDPNGGVLFSYLDQVDHTAQFMVRMTDGKAPLRVGKLLRQDYIQLKNIDEDFPLILLNDREAYSKLSECRDIVTNFRPTGQIEYNLKQRLLKVISEHLYSTGHRVEMTQPRGPRAPVLTSDNRGI